MEENKQESPELHLLLHEEIEEECTGDATVDMHGRASLKSNTGGWRACLFILSTKCFERLALHGVSNNLVTYLTTRFHQDNATAARNVTAWSGTSFLTSLLGALLADSYWGRYRTVVVFATVFFIALVLLTLSASASVLQPPPCHAHECPEASVLQYGVFFSVLYLIATAGGVMRPTLSPFGADQFDDTDSEERKKKTSFFNWLYFSMHVGSLISSTIIVWIQDNVGWGWGFGILTIFMASAIVIFFSGTPLYRFQKPGGSPLSRVFRVIVASVHNYRNEIPEDAYMLYEVEDQHSAIQGSRKIKHTNDFRFLDKAALVENNNDTVTSTSWILCTVTQVEELKILLRMFPIGATGIIFSAVYAQISTMFVEQGVVMDRSLGSFEIPSASLLLFDTISIILWVPIYDTIIVPICRKYTGEERGITQLQRMGIGIGISIIAMVAAAIVEIVRLGIAKEYDLIHKKTFNIPMSILWQIPQYCLVGMAETFFNIGHIEFFYDQSPDGMRSLCSALPLVTIAVGNYLSSLLVTVVTYISTKGGKPGWIPNNLNEGHLDYYFWLLAILSLLNLFAYIVCARRYKYKIAN